jgi:hypothetical protein
MGLQGRIWVTGRKLLAGEAQGFTAPTELGLERAIAPLVELW